MPLKAFAGPRQDGRPRHTACGAPKPRAAAREAPGTILPWPDAAQAALKWMRAGHLKAPEPVYGIGSWCAGGEGPRMRDVRNRRNDGRFEAGRLYLVVAEGARHAPSK
jgi:hypothetical protein